MRTIRIVPALAAVVAVTACSSSSTAPAPSLDGNWIYTNAAGTSGVALTLKQDGSYVGLNLSLTSSTSGVAQAEAGTFKVSGSTLSFTPAESSCPGRDPPYTATFSLNGDTLDLAFPTAAYAMSRNNAPASSNFQLAIGCFTGTSFVESPLAPVGAADAGSG